jgi:hypothetical protein
VKTRNLFIQGKRGWHNDQGWGLSEGSIIQVNARVASVSSVRYTQGILRYCSAMIGFQCNRCCLIDGNGARIFYGNYPFNKNNRG